MQTDEKLLFNKQKRKRYLKQWCLVDDKRDLNFSAVTYAETAVDISS